MVRFKQLNYAERQCIAARYAQKMSVAEIARRLCRSRSTIKREIERNGFRGDNGQWHYHPDLATKKYWHRQSEAGYGKNFRRYQGGKSRRGLWFLNGCSHLRRNYKEQDYRYRPFFWLRFKTERPSTQAQDATRFFRQSRFRLEKKKYNYPKKDRWLSYRLMPERKNRKPYYSLYYGFWYLKLREKDNPRLGRFWKFRWRLDRKPDLRTGRHKKQPYNTWPGGFVFQGQHALSEEKATPKLSFTIPHTKTQKPEGFSMALLCPDTSAFRDFSKNESLQGVDKSVPLRKVLLFS